MVYTSIFAIIKEGKAVLFCLLLTLCLAHNPDFAVAKATPVETELKVVSHHEIDPGFHPEEGTYSYDVFWSGAHIGNAYVTLAKIEELYAIAVEIKTNKTISLIYKLRYLGQAKVKNEPFTPVSAKIEQRSGRRKNSSSIEFSQSGEVRTSSILQKGKERHPVEKISHTPKAFGLDPFSAVCLIRRLDWQPGLAVDFRIYTGSKGYLTRFICQTSADIKVDGKTRHAWVISLQQFDDEGKELDTVESMRVYISQDDKKEILKITGRAKVGDVEARMKDFRPLRQESLPANTKEDMQNTNKGE